MLNAEELYARHIEARVIGLPQTLPTLAETRALPGLPQEWRAPDGTFLAGEIEFIGSLKEAPLALKVAAKAQAVRELHQPRYDAILGCLRKALATEEAVTIALSAAYCDALVALNLFSRGEEVRVHAFAFVRGNAKIVYQRDGTGLIEVPSASPRRPSEHGKVAGAPDTQWIFLGDWNQTEKEVIERLFQRLLRPDVCTPIWILEVSNDPQPRHFTLIESMEDGVRESAGDISDFAYKLAQRVHSALRRFNTGSTI